MPERTLRLNDPHLQLVVLSHHDRLANVNEYARAAGIAPSAVLESLADLLVEGVVSLEMHNNEMFIHPAPNGRPDPSGVNVPENLWERLRTHSDVERSYALWRLTRALEQGGWRVECDSSLLGRFPLGVYLERCLVPLLPYPPSSLLRRPGGPLDAAAAANRQLAVTCENGALADVATAIRAWSVSTRRDLEVLVLEAPRFSLTRLAAADNSVTPLYVERYDRD